MTPEEFMATQSKTMSPEDFAKFQAAHQTMPAWKQAVARYGPPIAKAVGGAIGGVLGAPGGPVGMAAGGTMGYLGAQEGERSLEQLLGIQKPTSFLEEAKATAQAIPEAVTANLGGMAAGTMAGRALGVAKTGGKAFAAKHLGLKTEQKMPTLEELGRILTGTTKTPAPPYETIPGREGPQKWDTSVPPKIDPKVQTTVNKAIDRQAFSKPAVPEELQNDTQYLEQLFGKSKASPMKLTPEETEGLFMKPAPKAAPAPVKPTVNPDAEIMRQRTMDIMKQEAEQAAHAESVRQASMRPLPQSKPVVPAPLPVAKPAAIEPPLEGVSPATTASELDRIMQARATQVPGINAGALAPEIKSAATPAIAERLPGHTTFEAPVTTSQTPGVSPGEVTQWRGNKWVTGAPEPQAPQTEIEKIIAGSRQVSPELAGRYDVTPESQALDIADMLRKPAVPLEMKELLRARFKEFSKARPVSKHPVTSWGNIKP
jgi:hypothetical protein